MNDPALFLNTAFVECPKSIGVLRQKAKRNKRSLNQVIIDELSAAALGRTRKADFSDLVGHWTPDPEFDEVIRSQRKIDR